MTRRVGCVGSQDAGGAGESDQEGGEGGARAVCVGTNLFTLAESVGSTESHIQLPARMTHDRHNRRRLLTADLIRLSIGLEDADDLILDLDKALAAAAS